MPLSPEQLAHAVKAKGLELGFDVVGITAAIPSPRAGYWREWVGSGQAGDMAFMGERLEERLEPQLYLGGARSAICVGLNYFVSLPARESVAGEVPFVPGKVARYALGEDYHEWMKKRLFKLADYSRELVPGSRTLSGVDAAPIPEREFASRAGVGWVGKNTMVINERIGSWMFLGVVLSTAELVKDAPGVDRCGTCRRCLDACPTGALVPERPYQMEARKCISYLTIEHKGEIPAELAPKLSGWIYGCDICQDVCPWNGRAPEAVEPRLQSRAFEGMPPGASSGVVNAAEVVNWTDEQWMPFSRRSAIRRLGLPLLKRNAEALLRGKGE